MLSSFFENPLSPTWTAKLKLEHGFSEKRTKDFELLEHEVGLGAQKVKKDQGGKKETHEQTEIVGTSNQNGY